MGWDRLRESNIRLYALCKITQDRAVKGCKPAYMFTERPAEGCKPSVCVMYICTNVSMCLCLFLCVYVHMYVYREQQRAIPLCVCCVYVSTCMCIYMSVYVCMYVCMD